MFLSILKLFAGSHHRKFLRKCAPLVKRINALETEYQKLSDDQLRAKIVSQFFHVEVGAAVVVHPAGYLVRLHDGDLMQMQFTADFVR